MRKKKTRRQCKLGLSLATLARLDLQAEYENATRSQLVERYVAEALARIPPPEASTAPSVAPPPPALFDELFGG